MNQRVSAFNQPKGDKSAVTGPKKNSVLNTKFGESAKKETRDRVITFYEEPQKKVAVDNFNTAMEEKKPKKLYIRMPGVEKLCLSKRGKYLFFGGEGLNLLELLDSWSSSSLLGRT